MDKLEEMVYYQTIIYAIEKPEFLESVRSISDKYLEISKSQDPDHDKRLTLMTGTYAHEPEVAYFSQYVAQSAWNILSTQGFAMELLATHFNEMWTQEHRFGSSMDTHVHPYGAQITSLLLLLLLLTYRSHCPAVEADTQAAAADTGKAGTHACC